MTKREHTDTVEAETPQRLMTQATAFYLAGRRCDLLLKMPPFGYHTVDAPSVISYALSIELFLKLIILLRTGQFDKEHNLQTLYNQLMGPEKQKIASYFLRGEEQLSCIIEDAAETFVRWRYAHEHDCLISAPDDLRKVCEAILSTLECTHPELKSWFHQNICE